MTDSIALPSYKDIEPRSIWDAFAIISEVPRESEKEEKIRARVLEWAAEHGFESDTDSVGNVVIRVPATPGHEDAPIVVLQAHMDMVCIADAGSEHNFDTDPIKLIVDAVDENLVLRADGTTLGADNGLGLAAGMAAALDPSVVHGPLELLVTVNEEAGMTGAKALSPDFIKGRKLLNLDTEEEGELCIGCAGAILTTYSWEVPTEVCDDDQETVKVEVFGLPGGHSGIEINQNRGNALTLLARILCRLPVGTLHLAHIEGGAKRNSIPARAEAIVVGAQGLAGRLTEIADRLAIEVAKELPEHGANLRIVVSKTEAVNRALPSSAGRQIVEALVEMPYGVLAISKAVPGLPQTSNNPAILRTSAGDAGRMKVTLDISSRSLEEVGLEEVHTRLVALAKSKNAKHKKIDSYPPWSPNPESNLLAVARKVYQDQTGDEPKVVTVHAGLECGIFAQQVSGLDMISFGPNIHDAHTPRERAEIESTHRFWNYLKAMLAELAKS